MGRRTGDTSWIAAGGGPKRYTLVFQNLNQGGTFAFPIPPSAITIIYPSRQNVTQTRAGMWVDDWGEGLITVTIQGSFGFGVNPVQNRTGHDTFAYLVQLWKARNEAVVNGGPNSYTVWLLSEQEVLSYECVIPDFRYVRDQSSPLLCRYQMALSVLRVGKIWGMSGAGAINTTLAPVSTTATTISSTNSALPNGNGATDVALAFANQAAAVTTTQSIATGVSLSVAAVAQAVYGAQGAAYQDAIRTTSALTQQPPGTAQGATSVTYPDRNSITTVPLDGRFVIEGA